MTARLVARYRAMRFSMRVSVGCVRWGTLLPIWGRSPGIPSGVRKSKKPGDARLFALAEEGLALRVGLLHFRLLGLLLGAFLARLLLRLGGRRRGCRGGRRRLRGGGERHAGEGGGDDDCDQLLHL